MLCAKCNQKEATIHFTTVVDGVEKEAIHLCKDCAPPMGIDFDKLDLKEVEALSVTGKKCEFCGRDAHSGEVRPGGGAICWCFDCGLERGGILRDILVAERPDLLQRSKGEISFLALCSDPTFQTWSAESILEVGWPFPPCR